MPIKNLKENIIHFNDYQIELYLNGNLSTKNCSDVFIYDEKIPININGITITKRVAEVKGFFDENINYTFKFEIEGYSVKKIEGTSYCIDLFPRKEKETETLRKLFENE